MTTPLKHALIADADGASTDRHLVLESHDWDEIRASTDDVYMPFRVRPRGTSQPWSTNYTASVGPFVLSRFRYGAAVELDRFEPEAGRGMLLTTLTGRVCHQGEFVTTAGESYLVDTSRARYRIGVPDAEHEQLNLTFSHRDLADLHLQWYGAAADPRLWELSFALGGPGSSWLGLLTYVVRGIAEFPDQVADGPVGRRMAEMVGMHILTEWTARLGVEPATSPCGLAPRYVVAAEEYLREHARWAPTLAEVANEVGVSVRALTLAFRRYRAQSPIAYLRDLRMEGARADLLAAGPEATVSSVIAAWGYVNHGVFARSYQQRFGELPSATLGRAR